MSQFTQFDTNKASQKLFKSRDMFTKFGLSPTNVQWNDVERSFGSVYGPNISDWTLREKNSNVLLPVVRPDNFTDKVAILSSDQLCVMVGNENVGGSMKPITLTNYLKEFWKYNPECPEGTNLYCPQLDNRVTVRAQAVPLPVDPSVGRVQFNPTCYSYQTREKSDPRNFIFVSSHLGTSGQTDGPSVENVFLQRNLGQGKMENMFFNATSSEMETEEEKEAVKTVIGTQGMKSGRNRVIFGQIPIKQKEENRNGTSYASDGMTYSACAPKCVYRSMSFSDANISYGKSAGINQGLGRTDLVRDMNQHITLTVCFYYAVPNGDLKEQDVNKIVSDINTVYKDGSWVGSLVVGQEMPVESTPPPIVLKHVDSAILYGIDQKLKFQPPKYDKNVVQTFPN